MNLLNKIDEYLVSKEYKKRDSYYPSEVSKCTRQLYYKWTEEPESNPIEPGGFWKMRIGDAVHDLIFDFLNNSGLEIVNEISFKKDLGLKYQISGRIDNLFIDDDGLIAGIEVKTSYGAGIRNLRFEGKPKQSDIEQIIVYMACTDVKRFYLLYVSRDDGYRTQFVIENTEQGLLCDRKKIDITFEKLLAKFKLLEQHVENKEIPAREFKVAIKDGQIKDKYQKDNVVYKSDWQCSFCQFKNTCWKEFLK